MPCFMGGGMPSPERVVIVYETLGENEGGVRHCVGKAARSAGDIAAPVRSLMSECVLRVKIANGHPQRRPIGDVVVHRRGQTGRLHRGNVDVKRRIVFSYMFPDRADEALFLCG